MSEKLLKWGYYLFFFNTYWKESYTTWIQESTCNETVSLPSSPLPPYSTGTNLFYSIKHILNFQICQCLVINLCQNQSVTINHVFIKPVIIFNQYKSYWTATLLILCQSQNISTQSVPIYSIITLESKYVDNIHCII